MQLLKKMKVMLSVILVAATGSLSAFQAVDESCNSCGPCNDWRFTAEALIFKACEDGLAYGTQGKSFNFDDGTVEVNTRIKNVHPDWHVGFRLGLGYELPCDCWGIALYWTHFQSHANSHNNERFNFSTTPGVENSEFLPAYGFVIDGSEDTGVDRTEARWKLHLDLVDVEFGRQVCLSQCLTIRPHIGIRAAWINQNYNIVNTVITPDTTADIQAVKLKSDFEGVGLRGGMDSQWDLGCGMSLYGNASASVLYGNFNVKSENDFSSTGATLENLFSITQKDDFCACRAVTDAAMGLRWKGCFCNDSIAVTFQVGWEHHLFFNQNQFEDFVKLQGIPQYNPIEGEIKNPQLYHGALCLKGVTIGAKIDF